MRWEVDEVHSQFDTVGSLDVDLGYCEEGVIDAFFKSRLCQVDCQPTGVIRVSTGLTPLVDKVDVAPSVMT